MNGGSGQNIDRAIGLLSGQVQQLMSQFSELRGDINSALRDMKDSLSGDIRDLKHEHSKLEDRVRKIELKDAEEKPIMAANKQIIGAVFKYGITAALAAAAAYFGLGG